MTHYFLDSSALIKRYIVESGANRVHVLVAPENDNVIVIAEITQVEVVSGTMRRRRDGTISTETARYIRALLDLDVEQEYFPINLSETIVGQAEDLLERHPLRAYDAIQLASALEANARLIAARSAPLIFVSADRRLLDAATAEGLSTDDPNAHP